jgi:hypothetical protein
MVAAGDKLRRVRLGEVHATRTLDHDDTRSHHAPPTDRVGIRFAFDPVARSRRAGLDWSEHLAFLDSDSLRVRTLMRMKRNRQILKDFRRRIAETYDARGKRDRLGLVMGYEQHRRSSARPQVEQ